MQPRAILGEMTGTQFPESRDMNSQKVAATLGTIIALLVMVGVVVYGPKPDKAASAKAPAVEAPKAPEPTAPPVRGPVVRDLPQ